MKIDGVAKGHLLEVLPWAYGRPVFQDQALELTIIPDTQHNSRGLSATILTKIDLNVWLEYESLWFFSSVMNPKKFIKPMKMIIFYQNQSILLGLASFYENILEIMRKNFFPQQNIIWEKFVGLKKNEVDEYFEWLLGQIGKISLYHDHKDVLLLMMEKLQDSTHQVAQFFLYWVQYVYQSKHEFSVKQKCTHWSYLYAKKNDFESLSSFVFFFIKVISPHYYFDTNDFEESLTSHYPNKLVKINKELQDSAIKNMTPVTDSSQHNLFLASNFTPGQEGQLLALEFQGQLTDFDPSPFLMFNLNDAVVQSYYLPSSVLLIDDHGRWKLSGWFVAQTLMPSMTQQEEIVAFLVSSWDHLYDSKMSFLPKLPINADYCNIGYVGQGHLQLRSIDHAETMLAGSSYWAGHLRSLTKLLWTQFYHTSLQ